MKLVMGLVPGPYISETEYKGAVISRLSSLFPSSGRWFSIESEETEPGFPDKIRISSDRPSKLLEFKYAKHGVIEFQKSQPLFYRQHRDDGFDMWILAWDNRFGRSVLISPAEVVAAKRLSMTLPEEKADYEGVVTVFEKELR